MNVQLAAMTGRDIRRILLLACLAAAVARRADAVAVDAGNGEPEPVADRAAALAARGETAQARSLLASSDSVSPRALFVLTCIELEDGRLGAALRAVTRLRSFELSGPEVLVLAKLVDERRRSPHAAWTDAVVTAWNAAGRPRRTGETCLAPATRQPALSPEIVARLRGRPDGLLIAFAEAEGDTTGLVESALVVAADSSQTLAVQLVALEILSSGKVPELKRPQAHAVARRLLARMSSTDADNGYFAAGVVLGVPENDATPLSAFEVVGLENAAKTPVFDLPIRPLFVAFRDAYLSADPGQASPMAFAKAVGALPLDIHIAFSKRVAATVAPELRARAITALGSAGARLGSGRSLLARMIGISLQTKAAELRGDTVGVDADAAVRKQLLTMVASMSELTLCGWPIPSFWRDWLNQTSLDEVALAKRLSE
jgi:hypothetical protein